MKAKEIIERILFGKGGSKEDYVNLIKEYSKAKCKEQRTLCANYYRIRTPNEKNNGTTLFEDIKNAPEPDFE